MNSRGILAGNQAPLTPTLPGKAVAPAVSIAAGKLGRTPNLERFYCEQGAELKRPISPLCYCRFNDPEWFTRVQQVALDLRDGIQRQYSGVTPAMVTHIDESIARIANLPIGRQFRVGVGTKRRFPDLRISGVRRRRAIELSEALLKVTRKDPGLVRHGVLGYLYAVDNRMQVLLTGHHHALFGRDFIRMVDQVAERLHTPWLCRAFEGVEVNEEHKDPACWFDELDVEPMEIPFGKPNKPGNRAELDHFRIHVCLAQGQNRESREFYEVMILAAVTELWRCVGP